MPMPPCAQCAGRKARRWDARPSAARGGRMDYVWTAPCFASFPSFISLASILQCAATPGGPSRRRRPDISERSPCFTSPTSQVNKTGCVRSTCRGRPTFSNRIHLYLRRSVKKNDTDPLISCFIYHRRLAGRAVASASFFLSIRNVDASVGSDDAKRIEQQRFSHGSCT